MSALLHEGPVLGGVPVTETVQDKNGGRKQRFLEQTPATTSRRVPFMEVPYSSRRQLRTSAADSGYGIGCNLCQEMFPAAREDIGLPRQAVRPRSALFLRLAGSFFVRRASCPPRAIRSHVGFRGAQFQTRTEERVDEENLHHRRVQ